jgi:hypothetical protein
MDSLHGHESEYLTIREAVVFLIDERDVTLSRLPVTDLTSC